MENLTDFFSNLQQMSVENVFSLTLLIIWECSTSNCSKWSFYHNNMCLLCLVITSNFWPSIVFLVVVFFSEQSNKNSVVLQWVLIKQDEHFSSQRCLDCWRLETLALLKGTLLPVRYWSRGKFSLINFIHISWACQGVSGHFSTWVII